MQFPISQAMVHCDGKWELYEERRARYNSPSRPSQMGSSQSSKAGRFRACAVFIPMALKCWMSLGLRAIHCYISLSAPHTTPTSHRNVPLLAKWEIAGPGELFSLDFQACAQSPRGQCAALSVQSAAAAAAMQHLEQRPASELSP